MFCVQYQWQIVPGQEAQFEQAWTKITKETKNNQNMRGAKLMKLDDGTYTAYAEWKSRKDWEENGERFPISEALREEIAKTIESTEKLLCMDVVSDLF